MIEFFSKFKTENMKKLLFFIFMISACIVMFGQQAHAVTVTVNPFEVKFNDPFPIAGCDYHIEFGLVTTDPQAFYGWFDGGTVSAPGLWSVLTAPFPVYSVTLPNSGYFQFVVRITKLCTGQVAYGYKDFVDYNAKLELYPGEIQVGSFQ